MARRVRVPLALAALLLAVAAPLAATAAKTHYEVLGVARDATLKDIRSAYRAKSLETHPDKGGSPEAFLEVAQVRAELAERRGHTAAGLCGHIGTGLCARGGPRVWRDCA